MILVERDLPSYHSSSPRPLECVVVDSVGERKWKRGEFRLPHVRRNQPLTRDCGLSTYLRLISSSSTRDPFVFTMKSDSKADAITSPPLNSTPTSTSRISDPLESSCTETESNSQQTQTHSHLHSLSQWRADLLSSLSSERSPSESGDYYPSSSRSLQTTDPPLSSPNSQTRFHPRNSPNADSPQETTKRLKAPHLTPKEQKASPRSKSHREPNEMFASLASRFSGHSRGEGGGGAGGAALMQAQTALNSLKMAPVLNPHYGMVIKYLDCLNRLIEPLLLTQGPLGVRTWLVEVQTLVQKLQKRTFSGMPL